MDMSTFMAETTKRWWESPNEEGVGARGPGLEILGYTNQVHWKWTEMDCSFGANFLNVVGDYESLASGAVCLSPLFR